MEKSLRFYTEILGMKVVERSTSPRGSELAYLGFTGADTELELCSFPSSGKVEVPEDLVHLAFEVRDLGKTIKKLNKANIPVTDGPIKTASGSIFIFTEDPDKYEIELIQYAES